MLKKLEIVIRPEKVFHLKRILSECHASGAMFSNISGYGNQKSSQYIFRGKPYFEEIFSKTKVETVVTEEIAEKLIERILKEIPTGEMGDGKIFVYDVAETIKIRTGEKGSDAV